MTTLDHFAAFVEREAVWFRGYNRETCHSLEQAEQTLQLALPASLKWLLTHYGYWRATGVGGLPFVVGTTRSFRPTFPRDWVILSRPTLKRIVPEADCGSTERGVVVLIASDEHPADGRAVMVCDIRGRIWRRYSGFAPYVVALQQQLARAADPFYRDCLPSFHQQNSGLLDAGEEAFDLEEFRQRLLEAMLCQQLAESAETSNSATAPQEEPEQTAIAENPFPVNPANVTPPLVAPEAFVSEVTRELAGKSASSEEPVVADQLPPEPPQLPAATGKRTESPRRGAAQAASIRAGEVSLAPLEQELRQILVERRETLQRAHVDIPRVNFHNSSSPNRALKLPDHLPSGRLLVTSLTMIENSLDLLETVIDPSQHIAILQVQQGRTHANWLVSWVADRQVSLLTNYWFRLTGAQPDWIMEAGEDLSDLPSRLHRNREAA